MKNTAPSTWGLILPFVLIIFFVVLDVTRTVSSGGFEVALAPALDPAQGGGTGRVPFDVLDPGPMGLYVVGYTLSMAGLAATAILLLLAAFLYSRHRQLTRALVRCMGAASSTLFLWGVGQFVINMGNNFAANRLGLLPQWEGMSTLDGQSLILWLMFLTVLAFVSTLLVRSLKLQEDQEGLV